MTKFILYLFETGICLSLLYLAYWFFLRRETYFNFNRVFLVASIGLALAVPLLHMSISIPAGSSMLDPAKQIVKFRDYYEELIRMSDADFGTEPGIRAESGMVRTQGHDQDGRYPSDRSDAGTVSGGDLNRNEVSAGRGGFSAAGILMILYITGVMYFLIRFLYLVFRLYYLARRNGITRQEGIRMVPMKEDISPFSFFRFLFINQSSFSETELENVLEHEKAHIRQRHSLDHLFAHGLAVFQWFNPFAWQIRTALKATHEFIADRQVLNTGVEPVDYQSLLLRQVIGYHSTELVNNFNLKPIKKRIIMMSKNRSGLPAKLKALLVIPVALIVFILFADFTLKGPGNRLFDIRSQELHGVWTSQGNDEFSKTIHFGDDLFSYTDGNEIKEYYWSVQRGELYLKPGEESNGIRLKYDLKGNNLKLWWNDFNSSEYHRTGAENSMAAYLLEMDIDIELPAISQFRLMENQKLLNKICLGGNSSGELSMKFNGKSASTSELGKLVDKQRSEVANKLDVNKLTNMFMIDAKISMKIIVELKQQLREIGSLKVAYAGYPEGDLAVSALQYHTVALPMVLPPMDARIIDKDEVIKKGTNIFTIDLSAEDSNPGDLDRNLEQFIRENEKGKYVFSLEYDGSISYGEYLESVDIVFNVVYRFRKELAMKKYQVPYAQLGYELQKEIRKEYPMVLSEAWSGH